MVPDAGRLADRVRAGELSVLRGRGSPMDYRQALDDLEACGLRRRRRTVSSVAGASVCLDGRQVCCFAGNNYLGLAGDERILAAVRQAVGEWGWGSGASSLISGTTELHRQLERRLAEFKRTEAALVFPSGYMANLAAIRAAAGRGDVIYLDKLNHASIIDAATAGGARVRVFGHRDYGRLEELLTRSVGNGRRLIVTDSLFSMDGDLADLVRLVELKKRYGATLLIDEAHATGVIGAGGRGVAEAMGVEGEIDITVGTLSKALGGVGGFVCGSGTFMEYLVNTARSYIYTTAVPAAVCAAAEAALDIVEADPQRRARLAELAGWVREELGRRGGLDIGQSQSQIVPVIVGSADRAVEMSRELLERGYWVPAIRPPSVPKGQSRLRISLIATHKREDVEGLIGHLQAIMAIGRSNG